MPFLLIADSKNCRVNLTGVSMIKKVNISQKLSLNNDYWVPRIIGELNGQYVKTAKFKGSYDWHSHVNEDEMFLVVKGSFNLELRSGTIQIDTGEFIIVPKGLEHRPVADEEAHLLLFEPISTLNTGNVRTERTLDNLERI